MEGRDYIKEELDWTEKNFNIKDVIQFQMWYDVQVVRGGDLQYQCFINGKGYSTGLTMLYALAVGIKVFKESVGYKPSYPEQTWLDTFFGNFVWYRSYRKGVWYQHEFTYHAAELTFQPGKRWWARYGHLNRYSRVVNTESYE